MVFNDNQRNDNVNKDIDNFEQPNEGSKQPNEVSLICYSQQSDFCRDLIKGPMCAQRCKLVIRELFQANVHSPLFWTKYTNSSFFSLDISGLIKLVLENWRKRKPKN